MGNISTRCKSIMKSIVCSYSLGRVLLKHVSFDFQSTPAASQSGLEQLSKKNNVESKKGNEVPSSIYQQQEP